MMGFQQESAEFQGGPPFSGEMLVSGSVTPSYLTTPPQRKTRPEHRAKFKNSSTPIRPRPSTKVSWVSDEWFSLCCGGVVVTLPKTNSSPLKRSRNSKRKDRLPNINFQELMLVSGRGYSMGGVGVRWAV